MEKIYVIKECMTNKYLQHYNWREGVKWSDCLSNVMQFVSYECAERSILTESDNESLNDSMYFENYKYFKIECIYINNE